MALKLSRWGFVIGLFLLGLSLYFKDQLPDPDFYDETLFQDPRQTATERQPFDVEAGDQTYRIIPEFDYELDGMVVSFNHADAWDNIYHRSWEDYLNIKDICVIWGDNLTTGVYQQMHFENTSWTCWVHWPDRQTGEQFRMTQLSNNHLLSHDQIVTRAILKAQTGDQVRFKGVLARYENPANGFKRGTSITRTDTGNGACETVYVDDFEIVRRANRGWRSLYALSFWLVVASALTWIGLIMRGHGQHER